jgi:anti-sigma B factor antagonist
MEWTEINERRNGDVVIVDLAGRMSLGEERRLFDAIIRLLKDHRLKILINLVGVSYLDSPGLGEIVSGYTTAARQGGALKLCQVGRRLQDLLAVTRLAGVIDVFDSEEEAIESFKS